MQCLRRLTRAMAYRDGKSKGLSLGRCFAIQKLQCSGCPACRSLCLPLFNSDLESIEYLPASHSISNASHAKCNQLLQYVTDGFTNCNCNSFTLGACLQAYSGRMQAKVWLACPGGSAVSIRNNCRTPLIKRQPTTHRTMRIC